MFTPRCFGHFLGIAALGAGSLVAAPANAHFVLQSPPAAAEQGPLGDPQKAPPCGDDGSAVATNVVTAYQAGGVVTITIDETIFHPGHYRIAVATNDISELPVEPPVTPGDSACGSTTIQDPPVFPVLADGVFLHDAPFDQPQSIDIPLPPDLNCDNCTLQVIQFMSKHGLNNPGGCFYHHCAQISVQGGGPETTGAGETGGEGTAGTDATSVTSTAPGTGSAGETAGELTTAGESGGGATGTATATEGGPTTGATAATATGGEASTTDGSGDDKGDGGCGCSGAGGGHGSATLLGLLGLLGLRARRRARG